MFAIAKRIPANKFKNAQAKLIYAWINLSCSKNSMPLRKINNATP